MPTPATVIRGSALGIQAVVPDDPELPDGEWVGETIADIMFSPGCWSSFPVSLDTSSYEGGQVRFKFVCDPTYGPPIYRRRDFDLTAVARRDRGDPYYNPIQIGTPEQVLNGPASTYDLGWELEDKLLPSGHLSFWISGDAIKRLALDEEDPKSGGEPAIPLTFTCCGLNPSGSGHRRDPLDKRWSLLLKTDPATGLLIIEEVRQLPVWCTSCNMLLEKLVFECSSCLSNVCEDCTLTNASHTRGHIVNRTALDCTL